MWPEWLSKAPSRRGRCPAPHGSSPTRSPAAPLKVQPSQSGDQNESLEGHARVISFTCVFLRLKSSSSQACSPVPLITFQSGLFPAIKGNDLGPATALLVNHLQVPAHPPAVPTAGSVQKDSDTGSWGSPTRPALEGRGLGPAQGHAGGQEPELPGRLLPCRFSTRSGGSGGRPG